MSSSFASPAPGSASLAAPGADARTCATTGLEVCLAAQRFIKLNAVSARIVPGIANVNEAMMWLVKDGTMWRQISRHSLDPSRRAAVTKSSVRRARNRPRTTRASPVQPMNERIMVMPK